jgi:transposase-like protein
MFLAIPELRYLRVKPIHIAFVLFFKFSGLTYDQISDGLWQFHKIIAKRSTLHDWVSSYGHDVAEMMIDVHIPLSGFIYLDEMCESIRIEDEFENYVRTDFWWMWNAYDSVHDIWREAILTSSRGEEIAYEIIDKIVAAFKRDKRCQKLYLITDGFTPYESAYNKHVQEGNLDPKQVILHSVPKQSNAVNYDGPIDPAIVNNIETFQTHVRALTRRMRKLKVFLSSEAPQTWLNSAKVHYNCVETISIPGKSRVTRLQNILPDFKQNRNRWLGFIIEVLKLRKHMRYVKTQTRKQSN